MRVPFIKFLKSKSCNLGTSGLLLTVLGLVLALYGFPKIIHFMIAQRIALKEGTEGYKLWKDMPFPLTFKVYIYNVTNPEDIANGSKPIVNEIGPYIYDQYRVKDRITVNDHDTLSYYMKKIFHFNATASAPLTQNDQITVLNLPLVGITIEVLKWMPSGLSFFNSVVPDLFDHPTDPFTRTNVGDFLFNGIFINCSSPRSLVGMACNGIKGRLPPSMKETSDDQEKGYIYSVLGHLNDTYDGPFSIERGIDHPELLGNTISYRNETVIDDWDDDCQAINGTDTTIFAPLNEANHAKKLYIFQPDFCRVVYADYVTKKTTFGLKSYRYETTKMLFASSSTNPSNKCYCTNNWSQVKGVDGCSLDGLQDLFPCQGLTVIASFPHFYLADPSLREYLDDNVQPDKEKHGTFVEIEPKTGAALKGAKRVQFNMELIQTKKITVLSEVQQGLFPFVWVEEGAEINDDIKKLLNGVHNRIKLIKVVQWIMVASGLIMVMAACYCKRSGFPDKWSWARNRVDLEVSTYAINSDIVRPGAAQKNSRQNINSDLFSITKSVAHK